MRINIERLIKMMTDVNQISSKGQGITRLAYTEEEDKALDWFIETCENYGFHTQRDQIGNVFATLGDIDNKGILIGSHLDTVKNGGRYDGVLGVLAGMEVLITLKENNIVLDRPLTVTSFRGEEANILGGTFGSRAFSNLIKFDESFNKQLETTPFTRDQIRESVNYYNYNVFLELHIEQGKTLENGKTNIGIVTDIAGIKRLSITVHGEPGHSGTLAMKDRNDALINTARILIEYDKIIKEYGEPNVGTVGELFVHPNLPNVIPGEVKFILEVRGTNIETMRNITNDISTYAKENCNVTILNNVEKLPSSLSKKIMNHISDACEELNLSSTLIMSGANHDANSLNSVMNSGMIFIPCYKGISHNPDEYASQKDIENGANTLLHSVLRLAK